MKVLNVNGKKDVFDGIGFLDATDGIIEDDQVEVNDMFKPSLIEYYNYEVENW